MPLFWCEEQRVEQGNSKNSNSPVDCYGACVRAEESFSFQWASLSFCAKKGSIIFDTSFFDAKNRESNKAISSKEISCLNEFFQNSY